MEAERFKVIVPAKQRRWGPVFILQMMMYSITGASDWGRIPSEIQPPFNHEDILHTETIHGLETFNSFRSIHYSLQKRNVLKVNFFNMQISNIAAFLKL